MEFGVEPLWNPVRPQRAGLSGLGDFISTASLFREALQLFYNAFRFFPRVK